MTSTAGQVSGDGAPQLLGPDQTKQAGAILAAGGLVGLPTETVYGLAADAGNLTAVKRVFAVKGRPTDHPLIVHVADAADLAAWAAEVPPQIRDLTARHWPGPLTVVVPAADWVPRIITGGADTVALRVPAPALTRRVIAELAAVTKRSGPVGVVAPSANAFGRVSPTTAAHVASGLAGRLLPTDAVLDGGACPVGLESTIVAVVDGEVRVLRPGAVDLGNPPPGRQVAAAPKAPGTLPGHYAPSAQVLVADHLDAVVVAELSGRVGLLAGADVPSPPGWARLAAPADDADYARQLYAALRAADEQEVTTVVAIPPGGAGPLAVAIRDRLDRAARGSRNGP